MKYIIIELKADGSEETHMICDGAALAVTEIERLESDFPDRKYRLVEYNQSESNTK